MLPAGDVNSRVTVAPALPMASLIDRAGVAGSTAVDQAAAVRVELAPGVDVTATVLRDLGANHAALVAVHASRDFGRLRLTLVERVDHTFIEGRDAVDVYTQLGASVEVAPGMRLGVDYLAQDLEDVLDDDHDGGLRQQMAADVQIARHGLLLLVGPTLTTDPHPLGFHAALGRTF